MSPGYDHRQEVNGLRTRADEARKEAVRVRAEAEATALAIERGATDLDKQAAHVHRLCTRGGTEPCCGLPPGKTE